MADRETASGELGLVQGFVNTVDLQDGPEELTDPNTLKSWLVANRLMESSQPVDDADLKHAIALREAIRGMIAANSGIPVYPVDVATLNHAAAASGLHMRFGTDGKPRLEPAATGVLGGHGRNGGAGARCRRPRGLEGGLESVDRALAEDCPRVDLHARTSVGSIHRTPRRGRRHRRTEAGHHTAPEQPDGGSGACRPGDAVPRRAWARPLSG